MEKHDKLLWCRICVKRHENTTHLTAMADNIKTLLNECLSIQFQKHDHLPHRICHLCLDVIQEFVRIKEESRKNEEILREYVRLKELEPKYELRDVISCLKLPNRVNESLPNSQVKIKTLDKVDDDVDENLTSYINGREILEIPKEPQYICKYDGCIKKFHRPNRLLLHAKRIHKTLPPTFPCEQCSSSFLAEEQLTRHVNCRHSESTTKTSSEKKLCPLCGKAVINMNTHMLVHDVLSRAFKCNECDASFYKKQNLGEHVKRKHLVKVCGVCGESYVKASHLAMHREKLDVSKATILCDLCSKSFVTKHQLRQHNRRVHCSKKVKCSICNREMRESCLKRHMLVAHEKKRDFQCTLCESRFSTSTDLATHVRTHTGERPYPCASCEKSFISSSALTKHLRVHTGERPYVCKICAVAFRESQPLKRHIQSVHMLTKQSKRRVKCPVCDLELLEACLRKHILVKHENKRDFICAVCAARCTNITSLTEHMCTHTGDRPYRCTYCEKGFISASTLRKHVRLHTGERPCVCKICGDAFREASFLQRHMQSRHVKKKIMERNIGNIPKEEDNC